jgi:hypothetical protein
MKFDIYSITSALLASSCCPIQIIINTLGFGCAGFAILTPYKPLFLTLTIASLTAKWRSTSHSRNRLRFVVYSVLVLAIATMDQWILQKNIISYTARVRLYGNIRCVFDDCDNSSSDRVKSIVLNQKIWRVVPDTVHVKQNSNLIMLIFNSELSFGETNETMFEEDFNREAPDGWKLTVVKTDQIHSEYTNQNEVYLKMDNVKCAACFKRAQTIVHSDSMKDWITSVLNAQFDPVDKAARFHISTTQNLQVEDELKQFHSRLENAIQQAGQKYRISKIIRK